MQGDDPPYLSVGTAVSAKYKGAFCEAKVSEVVRNVKCKVTYKAGLGTATVSDDQIKGALRVGQIVQVKHSDKKDYVEASITKIQDCSQYTVVFDDGDITTLKRTALCLKSGRHFNESETLDQLPLTHPEHFGNPVVGNRRGRRSRQLKEESSDEGETESDHHPEIYRRDIGRVVSVEASDNKKRNKDNWFPGLVVIPSAQPTVRINVKDEYLVRSFKDGRYYTVPKKEVSEFNRDQASKVESSVLEEAVQKALRYLDHEDLPIHWERSLLFNTNTPIPPPQTPQPIDSDNFSDSEDESHEERDHFIAHLYKFMEEAATPLNKIPVIAGRDVDLYRLFKVVEKFGGYASVNNKNRWRSVAVRIKYLEPPQTICNQVRHVYRKFLQNYESFNRALGCTMLNRSSNRSRTGRPLIRDKDRVNTPVQSPKSTSASATPQPQTPTTLRDSENEDEEIARMVSGVATPVIASTPTSTASSTARVTPNPPATAITPSSTPTTATGSNTPSSSHNPIVRRVYPSSKKLPSVADKKELLPLVELDYSKTTSKPPSTSTKAAAASVATAAPVFSRTCSDSSDNEDAECREDLLRKMGSGGSKTDNESNDQQSDNETSKEDADRTAASDEEEVKRIYRSAKSKRNAETSASTKLKTDRRAWSKSSPTGSEGGGGSKSKQLDEGTDGSVSATSTSSSTKTFSSRTNQLTRSKSQQQKSDTGGKSSSKSLSSKTISTKKPFVDEDKDNSGGGGSERDKEKKRGRKRLHANDDKHEDTSMNSGETAKRGDGWSGPVNVGDKLRVFYGPTQDSKVTYEAKVLKISHSNSGDGNDASYDGPLYFVHYTGWNTRYDEFIRPHLIAENISADKAKRIKGGGGESANSAAGSTGGGNASGGDSVGSSGASKTVTAAKRGRGMSITGRSTLPDNTVPPPAPTTAACSVAVPVRSITPLSSVNVPQPTTPSKKISTGSKSSVGSSSSSSTRSIRQHSSTVIKSTRRGRRKTSTPSLAQQIYKNDDASDSTASETDDNSSKKSLTTTRTRSGFGGRMKSGDMSNRSTTVKRRFIKTRGDKRKEDVETEKEDDHSEKSKPKQKRKVRPVQPKTHESDTDDESFSDDNNSNTAENEDDRDNGESSNEAASNPCTKGRDFDLNQIRSELKGFNSGSSKTSDLPVTVKEETKSENVTALDKGYDSTDSVSEPVDQLKLKDEIKKEEKDSNSDDIYEFKEPEPFNFDMKITDEKSKKRFAVRVFDEVEKLVKKKAESNESEKLSRFKKAITVKKEDTTEPSESKPLFSKNLDSIQHKISETKDDVILIEPEPVSGAVKVDNQVPVKTINDPTPSVLSKSHSILLEDEIENSEEENDSQNEDVPSSLANKGPQDYLEPVEKKDIKSEESDDETIQESIKRFMVNEDSNHDLLLSNESMPASFDDIYSRSPKSSTTAIKETAPVSTPVPPPPPVSAPIPIYKEDDESGNQSDSMDIDHDCTANVASVVESTPNASNPGGISISNSSTPVCAASTMQMTKLNPFEIAKTFITDSVKPTPSKSGRGKKVLSQEYISDTDTDSDSDSSDHRLIIARSDDESQNASETESAGDKDADTAAEQNLEIGVKLSGGLKEDMPQTDSTTKCNTGSKPQSDTVTDIPIITSVSTSNRDDDNHPDEELDGSKTEKEQLNSFLLCEETIPGSPAPANDVNASCPLPDIRAIDETMPNSPMQMTDEITPDRSSPTFAEDNLHVVAELSMQRRSHSPAMRKCEDAPFEDARTSGNANVSSCATTSSNSLGSIRIFGADSDESRAAAGIIRLHSQQAPPVKQAGAAAPKDGMGSVPVYNTPPTTPESSMSDSPRNDHGGLSPARDEVQAAVHNAPVSIDDRSIACSSASTVAVTTSKGIAIEPAIPHKRRTSSTSSGSASSPHLVSLANVVHANKKRRRSFKSETLPSYGNTSSSHVLPGLESPPIVTSQGPAKRGRKPLVRPQAQRTPVLRPSPILQSHHHQHHHHHTPNHHNSDNSDDDDDDTTDSVHSGSGVGIGVGIGMDRHSLASRTAMTMISMERMADCVRLGSRFNFITELDPSLDSSQRIATLQQKLQDLRKTYASVKAELVTIERRRKKIRRKEREALKAARQELAGT